MGGQGSLASVGRDHVERADVYEAGKAFNKSVAKGAVNTGNYEATEAGGSNGGPSTGF